MLLCDRDLKAAVADGALGITGYDETLVQPSSIDVRLDCQFLAWEDAPAWEDIDPREEPDMNLRTVPNGEPFRLERGAMVLASTFEQVTLAGDLAARVEGRSSIGRLGVAVHVTAGFIDPGFSGHVTLELVNHAPRDVLLWPGMRIGQLCVFRLSGKADRPYGSAGVGSHYQGQRGPTGSRAHVGWRTWPT